MEVYHVPKPTIRPYHPNRAGPRGEDIYYGCLICGAVLPSDAEHAVNCKCYNLGIDVDAGRLAIQDSSQVVIIEGVKKPSDVSLRLDKRKNNQEFGNENNFHLH
jgi:hypothetical protein